MGIEAYLEDKGLSALDYTVYELGHLFSFTDVFPTAKCILPPCVYEYFNYEDGFKFLPFGHVELYEVESNSLIWVCRYCNFWCEIFDPLIMERHVCVDCARIPPQTRDSFRRIVHERLIKHFEDLFS